MLHPKSVLRSTNTQSHSACAQDGYATGWFGAAEQGGRAPLVVGEKSPSYMYLPKVPLLMHAVAPQAKLLALLRNPIDRALSQWHMRMRSANQSDQVTTPFVTPDELMGDNELAARGRYAQQLQRFVSEGFSHAQLLVEIYEDCLLHHLNLSRIYAFLGVADQRPPSATRISELLGSYAIQHAVVTRNDTRTVLRDHFACAVQELRWWLRDERPARLDLWTDFAIPGAPCSRG